MNEVGTPKPDLLAELRGLMDQARQQVAQQANSARTRLYWRVCNRLRHEVRQERRAGHSRAILATLSERLGWSNFVELLSLKQPLERKFYAEICRVERWGVRTLRERIGSQPCLFPTFSCCRHSCTAMSFTLGNGSHTASWHSTRTLMTTE